MPTMNEMIAAAEFTVAMRKFRQILVYVAPTTAAPVTTLTGPTGAFLAVPPAYIPVGLLRKDAGVTFPRSVDKSETESINHGSATREDTESDDRMVKFTAQQTTKTVLELSQGLNLSGVTRAANGEVSFPHPELPDDMFYRLLVIGFDPKYQIGAGKFLPQWQPMDFPETKWGNDVTDYEITGKAFPDDVLGYSVWDIAVCGPGAITHAAALGFTAAGP